MVRMLDSWSSSPCSGPGLGYYVEFLHKTLYSLGASLHPGASKWVPAKMLGLTLRWTGILSRESRNAGGNPAMYWHPIQGEVEPLRLVTETFLYVPSNNLRRLFLYVPSNDLRRLFYMYHLMILVSWASVNIQLSQPCNRIYSIVALNNLIEISWHFIRRGQRNTTSAQKHFLSFRLMVSVGI